MPETATQWWQSWPVYSCNLPHPITHKLWSEMLALHHSYPPLATCPLCPYIKRRFAPRPCYRNIQLHSLKRFIDLPIQITFDEGLVLGWDQGDLRGQFWLMSANSLISILIQICCLWLLLCTYCNIWRFEVSICAMEFVLNFSSPNSYMCPIYHSFWCHLFLV